MAGDLDDVPERKSKKNGTITQLRPGQKEKTAREPRPPAERPRVWPAPEVQAIANRLIAGPRKHMSVLRGARIVFVFTNAEHLVGDNNVAHAQRFSTTYTFDYEPGAEPHFLLKVAAPQWARIPEELQEQCVYHYLLHFGSDTQGRWRTEAHDFEGFLAELEEFKDSSARWNEGYVRARQLGLFDGIASAELVESVEQQTPAGRR